MLYRTLKKNWLTRLAARASLTVIPTWRMEDFPLAEHTRRIFDQYEVNLALDVGGNRGLYRNFLREQVGYSGDIVTFEPIPELAQQLRERAAKDNRWTIVEAALAETGGIRTFNIMQADVFSSFLAPDHSQLERPSAVNQVVRTIDVRAERLADWSTTFAGYRERTVFLKLDTQGYDLHVLQGAGESLNNVVALQTELSFVSIYSQMPGFKDVLAWLEKAGFDPSFFFPVSFLPDISSLEMDGILVRRRPAAACPVDAAVPA